MPRTFPTYRFEALRRYSAGEGALNEIFEQYLGKTTPRSDPLPERALPNDGKFSLLPDGSGVFIPPSLRTTSTPEGDIAAYIASLKPKSTTNKRINV